MIIDGGSTDCTSQVVKKYEKYVTWISEPDKGQADAINKGIKRASGDIIAFINSDDYYLSDVFYRVVNIFSSNPKIGWITGDYVIINAKNELIQSFVARYKKFYRNRSSPHTLRLTNYIVQPSTFWGKRINQEIGLFDISLQYAFDYDFWLRLIDKYPFECINEPLSAFRIHDQSKGGTEFQKQFKEEISVLKRYEHSKFEYLFHIVHNWLIVHTYDIIRK